MSTNQFEILGVKPAPEEANYLGKVSFAYRPSEMQSVRITRSAEVDGKWRSYTEAEIEGARIVRVRSAFLCRSKGGDLYVRSGTVDVPWDLSLEVATQAFARLEGEQG